MTRDIEGMERYYENVPYGDNSLASEIHGTENEEIIKQEVKRLVQLNDSLLKQGLKEEASKIEKMIYHIDKEVANAEVVKQEHAASLRSTSNWGDMSFLDKAMTEQGKVGFNEEGKFTMEVFDERSNGFVSKTTEAMSMDFEEIGDWMQPLMKLKERIGKAKNNMGNPPPFDINYAVNNLIKNNWKSMIADPDPTLDPNGPSKGYRLQSILLDAVDENGNLPKDYNLDKNSFDPTNDTRLFSSISKELHNTFYGTDGSESKETAATVNEKHENSEAEKLMKRLDEKA